MVKIKLKKFNFFQSRSLVLVKKYLPGAIIVIILISTTTHNILAKNYTTDEYVNKTMLASIVASDELIFSDLIEESGPAVVQPTITNYIENRGNLQELVVATPFAPDVLAAATDLLSDSSSLVLNQPNENDSAGDSAEASDDRDGVISYTVQAGDVLGKIAERFNVTVNTILWENDLTWNSTIRPGLELTILPNSGINHEVKSGDTVLAIAKKYQSDAREIVKLNKLADSSDIQIGDLLFIPGGIRPTAVVSSYRRPAPATPNVPAPDNGSKFLWPLLSHRMTQNFNWRHHGVDIGDKMGNPIYAAEGGRVERSGWSRGYGYNIVVNHGNGIKTLYAHNSKLIASVGQSVSRGETIALIGSTGWSTGPHLHFEVQINGTKVNPLNYIK